MRLASLVEVFVFVCLAASSVAQEPFHPAGIKAKVAEASKLRESSNDAFATNNVDEGRKLGEQSAKLLNEARAEYNSIHAGQSTDSALLVDYADLLSQMGDIDLAETALLRAVSTDPENATAWLKLGQAESAMGPRSETRAIRALRKAASFEPKNNVTVQANASLGALYQQAGLYDFARESYTKALEQDPTHIGSKLAIASLDAREGRMVEAKNAYDSIGNASVEYGAFIKQTLGVALSDFEKSRRWLPEKAEAHLAYAELLVRVDRLPDSIWPLNRAVKLDDKNYVAWNLMGSVLRVMNQPKGAREAFARSLDINQDQSRTRDAIAELDKALAESGGSQSVPTDGSAATGAETNPAPPATTSPAEAPAQTP